MRKNSLLASGLLFIAMCTAWWMNSHQVRPVVLIPTLTGQPEYCLSCHADLAEISSSHPQKSFGCVLCHGGERLALDADLAHSSMRGGNNPSDLTVVEESCGGGKCHSGSAAEGLDHIQRVKTSIQSTYAGAIANIRYTFGAQPDLKARMGITSIADSAITSPSGVLALTAFDPSTETNPLIQQFATNCLTCHLNAAPRPGSSFVRLTGCAACHTPDVNSFAKGQVHRLTTAISYTQCNTCHNRGNYNLRSMSFIERNDLGAGIGTAPSDRLHDYYQPIAQFTRCEYTLDCVDCHTRSETMGDGDLHSNKKDIQYIQCKTCHGTLTELPLTYKMTAVDILSALTLPSPKGRGDSLPFKLAFLNPVVELKAGDVVLMTEKGEPLWNTRVLPNETGGYEMTGKANKLKFSFRAVKGTTCQQKVDEQGSQYCHQCHAVGR